jgi:hypothetical protein
MKLTRSAFDRMQSHRFNEKRKQGALTSASGRVAAPGAFSSHTASY